ncbi:MAG: endonuclease/exonuclease/phosphatase family protein [Alistipes sp.]|jgi:endonuclease/exonuclease/phosphatase family metal-dependent hydrolase|nr:endonuclease/exonuclease/phosphatase family protein [Alistipes sp.]
MRPIVLLLLFLSACSLALPTSAQRVSVAFWNVENLFDTIPSPFYDDTEFTPRGANRWDTDRYRTKIRNLARVIDELSADIVGLAEVENESVVRDLVLALETDYNYIHRTSGDSRGIDQALLYKGDKFFPDLVPAPAPVPVSATVPASLPALVPDSTRLSRAPDPAARLLTSGMGREFLHVRGELLGERIDLIVCHMASNLNSIAWRRRNMQALRGALENLLARDPSAAIVVMGDMNAVPDDRVVRATVGSVSSPWDFMYAPHWQQHRSGIGSYNWRGRWYLYDWMMVSPSLARGAMVARNPSLRISDAGIYAKEYLTESVTSDTHGARRPLRTFYAGDYLGGFSDHFPVWLVIERP